MGQLILLRSVYFRSSYPSPLHLPNVIGVTLDLREIARGEGTKGLRPAGHRPCPCLFVFEPRSLSYRNLFSRDHHPAARSVVLTRKLHVPHEHAFRFVRVAR